MDVKLLFVSARTAVLELSDGGLYETKQPYDVYLNGRKQQTTERVITNLFGLKPQTRYELCVTESGKEEPLGKVSFETGKESVTLNVLDFGAKGDGQNDDTLFIQAAITSCPADGRVLVPAGEYRIRFLTLKSGLNLCLEKGARLLAYTEPDKLPFLPGEVQRTDESGEIYLGSWEGNPLPCHMGILSGFYVEHVHIYGEGVIDGGASFENWWKNRVKTTLPGRPRDTYPQRPRLFFLTGSKDVTVQGVLFTNSPSWTIHPMYSQDLSFYGCAVENPAVSPNTDGLDPEGCTGVKIIGMRFSLGDDCIAVKAGKVYMARATHTPSRNVTVRQCLLANGHGAVTIGSEMAGGVYDLTVRDCLFVDTDRGLRIKTRRGRGDEAVVDGILFENIKMKGVMTPIVVNSFYYCDPDGHHSYVQTRKALPVDERTPFIKSMTFRHISCEDCHVQAVYVEGLPEQKVEELTLEDVHFSFAQEAKEGVAAMSDGVEKCSKKGMFLKGIKKVTIKNVTVQGQEGAGLLLDGRVDGEC